MARDFLAIPSSGVGVERLFNSARDICHYRRSRLLPDTIHALMLLMCTENFTIRQEFEAITDDMDTTPDDRQSEREEIESPNLISDDEDIDNMSEGEMDMDNEDHRIEQFGGQGLLSIQIDQPITESTYDEGEQLDELPVPRVSVRPRRNAVTIDRPESSSHRLRRINHVEGQYKC